MPELANLPATITRPLWVSASGLFSFLVVLILWSIYAPMATTIRANGSFASSRPSYDIQHPFGGRIQKVFVALHETVTKNSPLFLLDVDNKRKSLSETQLQVAALNGENRIIKQYLTTDNPIDPFGVVPGFLQQQYHEARLVLDAKMASNTAAAATAQERLQTVKNSIALLEERKMLYFDRSKRRENLVSRGIVAQKENDALKDTILSLGSELEDKYSLMISLKAEAAQTTAAVKILHSEYRKELIVKLNANIRRSPELRRQIANLQYEIDIATVRAPINGKVIALNFSTQQMYAGKGQTLATLAQNLDHPVVHMKVPVGAIDQVYNGMSGVLTIPALPQRDMPKIRLLITSLSPEAQKDTDGLPEHYLAIAKINPDDLKRAKRQMGSNLRLSTDMPVSVALEGRKTTMYQYLFGAFANLFTDALQD